MWGASRHSEIRPNWEKLRARHDRQQGVEHLAPALSLGRMSKVRFVGLDIVDWLVLLGGSTLIGLMTLLV